MTRVSPRGLGGWRVAGSSRFGPGDHAGRTPRSRIPGPEIRKGAGSGIMKTREENRKKLAETEKRDASDA